MEKRTLAYNAIWNTIKTLVTYVFPLVTYMYAARIFLSEGIGKINFSMSYITYFILFAMLGIEKYGIREVAKVKDSINKRSHLVHELLMLNLGSVIITYIFFFMSIFLVRQLQIYRIFLLINSASIIFTAMGMNWLYVAVEDYKYITLRSCLVNVGALIALILFVHSTKDIYIYVIIQTIATTGSNILNFIHSKKYVIYKKMENYEPLRHLKPVITIFSMTLFIEVFTHLDVTMLGLISGDYVVGIYTAAHKVGGIVTALITAAAMVIMPRIAYCAEEGKKEKIAEMAKDTVNLILMLSVPCAVGVFLFSEQLILVISGSAFLEAVVTSRILAGRVLFSSLNAFIVLFLFIPLGKERNNVISTGAAAITNFLLNMVLIKILAEKGAAIATVIAEIVEFIINLYFLKREVSIRKMFINTWQYVLAGSAIVCVYLVCTRLIRNMIVSMGVVIIISALLYFGILVLLKNKYIKNIVKQFI